MRQSIASRVMVAGLLIGATTSCAPLGQLLGTEFKAEPSRAVSILPCPPLRRYNDEEQRAAFETLTELLERGGYGAVILDQMLDDYYFVREACR